MEEAGKGASASPLLRLSSWRKDEDVELRLEVSNRSGEALILPLGSFTAGTKSGTVLAASLQSQQADGTWKPACVLQPRNCARHCMAMFLPPWQAIKMPIIGLWGELCVSSLVKM